MRWVSLCLLFACGGAPAVSEPSSGAEETPEEYADGERPGVVAVRVLLAFDPAVAEPPSLAAAVDEVADALEQEGSRLVEGLRGTADSLRSGTVSERDVGELVEMAIEFTWQLLKARADEGPHPAACDIGRALALEGFEVWRAALTERFERESLSVGPEDYEHLSSERSPCDELDDSSELEDCDDRRTAARAHRVAFAADGPLTQLQLGFESGPAGTVTAIESYLDETRPLFRLVTPRPRRRQIADLAPLCAIAPV